MCVLSPGMEPHIQAFEVTSKETPTTHRHLYLRTSPEYHMKRALATSSNPIFQLGRCFRDEPASKLHHPEFTMLEWYRRDSDYTDLMDDCEELVVTLAHQILEQCILVRDRRTVSLDTPWQRISVREAFVRWAGFDPFELEETESLRQAALTAGLQVEPSWPWEDIFNFVFIENVESNLGLDRPTILYGYPPRLAALSRIVDDRAERFELYIGGVELANAFSELVDPVEQRARFRQEQAERRALGRPVYPIDESLQAALERLPPSAGIALGVDRLWLLFAEHLLGKPLEIADVLFFRL